MKIKTRRWTLAFAAVSATAALSGIGASGAQAALPGHCLGANIAGGGASLQATAQSIWNPRFNVNTTGGCVGAGTPTATYTSSSSGTCLTAFGANGGAINTATQFCGTDDAPDTTQINNIATTTSNTARALTVPVAQAAVAVVATPPSGCTISTITPAQIEQVFRGTITTWSGLTSSGTCTASITKVVRNDASGTTYAFKHYLFNQNSAVVHNSLTWAGLQTTVGGANTTWPGTVTKSQSGCATAMALPCSGGANSGSGGSDLVRTVGAASNAIGYASLADARGVYAALGATWPQLKWIPIRNSLNINVDPSTPAGVSATRGKSNCPTAGGAYNTPANGVGVTGNWSGVYPVSATNGYPICALTYDLAVTKYEPTWTNGTAVAQTVKDYLHYILTGGDADALNSNNDYQQLPTDIKATATTGVTTEITG